MNCSDLFATGIRRINILKYNNISETIPETDNPLRKLVLELSSFRTTLWTQIYGNQGFKEPN